MQSDFQRSAEADLNSGGLCHSVVWERQSEAQCLETGGESEPENVCSNARMNVLMFGFFCLSEFVGWSGL